MFTKRNYCVGLIIFVAVWVLILAVPKTRNILRSQTNEIKWANGQSQFLPTPGDPLYPEEVKPYYQHADNLDVKMTLLHNKQNDLPRAEPIKEYDALLKEHPKNIWIIKARLLAVVPYGIKLEMSPALQKRTFFSLFKEAYERPTPDEISRALIIARYGEKLEPENSFYDWLEATFLFAQGKTSSALKTLQKGSHKKYYDSGYSQFKKAAVIAATVTGNNLFEERLSAFNVSQQDTICISETNMAAVWQGALAEQRGDQQLALQIYATQQRLCSLMFSPNFELGSSNDAAMLSLDIWLSEKRFPVWKKLKPVVPPASDFPYSTSTEKKFSYWRKITAASLFAKYARANHRPDLANEAMQLAQQTFSLTNLYQSTSPYGYWNLLYGNIHMKILFQLKWIGIQLLGSLKLLVPLFLLITIPLILALRNNHKLTALVDQHIKFVHVISATLFVICIYGFLLAFALTQGISSRYYYGLFPMINFDNLQDHIDILQGYINIYYLWIPFIACYLYCTISTLWKCRKSTFVNEIQETLALSIGEEKLEKISKRISIAHQIVWWIIVALLELFWFQWVATTNLSYILIPLTLILSAIIWWFTKNIQLRAPALFTGTYWLLFATWLQRSLAILILICTLAYGVTSWASLPLRHNANIQLDHVLKVGEVTALREAIQRDKAQNPDANAVE